ncbi:MAG: AgmX/PglI C-terminal domain-containing protein [Enhygromyxa sp.]
MSTQQQNARPVLLALSGALVLAGVGAGFFFIAAPAEPESVVMIQAPPPMKAPAPPQPAPAPTPVTAPAEQSPTADRSAASAQPSKASRLARDLQREKIWTALGREHNLKPAEQGSAAPSSSAAALLPTLDADYVRDAIKEQLVPVAVDCYNTVLTRQDEQAGGKLLMKITIVGVEEVGGVVEEVELDEESTLDNEFLRECLRESMMTVVFDPPPNGGRVEVHYPLYFTPPD